MTILSFRFNAFSGITAILVIGMVFQAACSPPAQILKEPSAFVRPPWIVTLPPSSDLLYFVGIKTGTNALEEGREGAIKDAMAKIANFLGSKVQSAFEEHSTEIEQKLKQQITAKSTASIFGAQVVDWYHEKTIRIDKKFRTEKYDVYVLVSFKKSEVEKEIQRQQKEKSGKVMTAYDLYLKGRESEKQKVYQDAHQFYGQALDILNDLDEFVTVDSGEIKNSEELTNLLKTRNQEVISKMRRVALYISVHGPEKGLQVFQASFASALSTKGFTVTKEEPAIEISGDLSVEESSFVMNNFAYYAEGDVSARRISDGQVIAVVPVKVKGFHKTREQAALNALAEAGTEAGEILSKSLLEKENSKD